MEAIVLKKQLKNLLKEHRKCIRTATTMDVRLYKSGDLLALAKAVNLTLSGMYIATDGLLYPKGSSLTLVFNEPETSNRCSVEANVAHRTTEGIGVKFKHAIERDSLST